MVGQRVDDDGGVLPGFDDLVEVADGSAPDGPGERPSIQTVSPPWMRNRPTRSEAVRSSWQATVMSSCPRSWAIASTKRVLPQPVGPLSRIDRPCEWAPLKILSSPFCAR